MVFRGGTFRPRSATGRYVRSSVAPTSNFGPSLKSRNVPKNLVVSKYMLNRIFEGCEFEVAAISRKRRPTPNPFGVVFYRSVAFIKKKI